LRRLVVLSKLYSAKNMGPNIVLTERHSHEKSVDYNSRTYYITHA